MSISSVIVENNFFGELSHAPKILDRSPHGVFLGLSPDAHRTH